MLQALSTGAMIAASKYGFIFGLFTDLRPDGRGRKLMKKVLLRFSILAGCFLLASLAATAQEVEHALVGTVSSIDATAKTITVKTDDGSEVLFKDMISSKTRIEFDKNVRKDATVADEFKKSGAYVIVYYFGIGNVRTVVALRSLGPGPFTKSTGTVVKFESKEHSISIKGESGVVESFKITSNTVAETDDGAIEGLKLRPNKGDLVQVTATAADGNATALFINASYAP
jgi:Cu/Ag efflux protein CusF